VVLGDSPFVASGEVRGSAPATREFALLDPTATVQSIDSVVLSGGSAFGLVAGDGVMSFLAGTDRGFPTPWGKVPIVVGMSLFDLPVGDSTVHPSAHDGDAAAHDAMGKLGTTTRLGLVGAGTGATASKWRGEQGTVGAGLGGAVLRHGELVVAALVVVNAWGDIVGSPAAALPEPEIPGDLLAGESPGRALGGRVPVEDSGSTNPGSTNTTIGVIATNAALDKLGCLHTARGAHDGLARAISPPHTSLDGDAFVALATGAVAAPQDRVRWMAVQVTEAAIRSVVRPGD
jgi:L-aminopeptidase/D-esterase-like protein